MHELPSKMRGHPLLLRSELDERVQLFLKQLHGNGVVINTAIVMATAEGIVQNKDSNLLAKNGGKDGSDVELVDLSLVRVKPLAAMWLIKVMDYLKQNPDIAKNEFCKSGLL